MSANLLEPRAQSDAALAVEVRMKGELVPIGRRRKRDDGQILQVKGAEALWR